MSFSWVNADAVQNASRPEAAPCALSGRMRESGMSFQSEQRKRLTAYALERYGVKGHILPYELVAETLHESYRDQTLAYFARHKVKWWSSRYDVGRPALGPDEIGSPTGHLNSSQVACVNHLEPARLDVKGARHLLANIDADLGEPVPVEDGGFVAYEWIGQANYLNEPGSRTRGAQVTSLDALMCGQRADGCRTLVAFEWKYLESYGPKSRATSSRGTDRVAIYRPLLERDDSPIGVEDPRYLFFDPYEQLMRQTLLAWQMVEHHEFEARDWIHVHVVPEKNLALRGRGGAAPDLVGETMGEAWRSVLKEPGRYRLLTASDLLQNVRGERWRGWRSWLGERYET
jgi:hypothetical protein